MSSLVDNAALAEGVTNRTLLTRLAEEKGFTDALSVGTNWWRRHRHNSALFLRECPAVASACSQIVRATRGLPNMPTSNIDAGAHVLPNYRIA